MFISDTVDRALSSGFAQGTEYLQVWTTYCDYLRRKIAWDAGKCLLYCLTCNKRMIIKSSKVSSKDTFYTLNTKHLF